MKPYSPKICFCAVAAFGLALTSTFTACGDSNTTEVTEQTSIVTLAKGEKMPECTNDNVGDMLYVTDSAAVYYCAEKKWVSLNGKDGEPGEQGASAEGVPGASCTAKTVKEGIEISCGGKVIGTVKNGEPGSTTDGENGSSCKIDDTKGDGIVEVTCGKGETAKTVEFYKAACGKWSYDPAAKFCFDGRLYELCDGKNYNPLQEYCLTSKDKDGNEKTTIEELLIDKRDLSNVRVYKTVAINGETWMAENLNYDTNTEEEINSGCGGSSDGCDTYGRIYTNNIALTACPDGWHLPNDAEWSSLITFVGGSSIAGKKLKSASINGENLYNFAVLPAGYGKVVEFDFEYTSRNAFFWTYYTKDDEQTVYATIGFYSDANYYSYFKKNENAYSIRCVKDKPKATSN